MHRPGLGAFDALAACFDGVIRGLGFHAKPPERKGATAESAGASEPAAAGFLEPGSIFVSEFALDSVHTDWYWDEHHAAQNRQSRAADRPRGFGTPAGEVRRQRLRPLLPSMTLNCAAAGDSSRTTCASSTSACSKTPWPPVNSRLPTRSRRWISGSRAGRDSSCAPSANRTFARQPANGPLWPVCRSASAFLPPRLGPLARFNRRPPGEHPRRHTDGPPEGRRRRAPLDGHPPFLPASIPRGMAVIVP